MEEMTSHARRGRRGPRKGSGWESGSTSDQTAVEGVEDAMQSGEDSATIKVSNVSLVLLQGQTAGGGEQMMCRYADRDKAWFFSPCHVESAHQLGWAWGGGCRCEGDSVFERDRETGGRHGAGQYAGPEVSLPDWAWSQWGRGCAFRVRGKWGQQHDTPGF